MNLLAYLDSFQNEIISSFIQKAFKNQIAYNNKFNQVFIVPHDNEFNYKMFTVTFTYAFTFTLITSDYILKCPSSTNHLLVNNSCTYTPNSQLW